MTWQEIRAHYPKTWLLLEAIRAHSEDDKRILDGLALLGEFPDSATTLRRYAALHREFPLRESYVLHTDRATLDITERRWLGIRGVR